MRSWRLHIDLETPSKKNSRINTRSGRSFPSKRYSAWHKEAEAMLKLQCLPDSPIDFPVRIRGSFTRGDHRRRDNNNGGASILDLFVDLGILADDNDEIVVRETWEKVSFDKNNPRVDIVIEELDNAGLIL